MLHRGSVAQILCASAIMLTLTLTLSTVALAAPGNIGAFFHSLTGEWIGRCEQTTDGKQADNKYFHAVIKQAAPNIYESRFDYYRLDQHSGAPLKIGVSKMTTTIGADGTVKNAISGSGQVMIDENTSKAQKHELSEILTTSPSGGLQGRGTGTINVSGMPFNAGKSGKIKDDRSTWSLSNGVLKISQQLRVGFKALIFGKSFDIAANFTARRGTNVLAMMMGERSYVSKLGGASAR
jgi:hypothetical protein